METKHCFVSALDLHEQLPFILKKTSDLPSKLKERHRVHDELDKFILQLQKNFGEKIYHLGSDILSNHSYEKFMFKGSGFMELMIEAPLAINVHFHDNKRAVKFSSALKKTIKELLPQSPKRDMLIHSISIEDEHETPMRFKDWDKIRNVRSIISKSVTILIVTIFIFLMLEIIKAIIITIAKKEITLLYSSSLIQSIIAGTIALILGLCIHPLERFIEHIMAKYIFHKREE